MEKILVGGAFPIFAGDAKRPRRMDEKSGEGKLSNTKRGEDELIMIGRAVPLIVAHSEEGVSNAKAEGKKFIKLGFAPATASIVFENEAEGAAASLLANAGFDPNESRIPAGQPGAGQWTKGSGGTAPETSAEAVLRRAFLRHTAEHSHKSDSCATDGQKSQNTTKERQQLHAVENCPEPAGQVNAEGILQFHLRAARDPKAVQAANSQKAVTTAPPEEKNPKVVGRVTVLTPPNISADSHGGTSAEGKGNALEEQAKTLLEDIQKALEAGGQKPTFDQLEKIGEACDRWQEFAVSQGVSPFLAGEQVADIIHRFYNPGAGPNPGTEGILGAVQGQPAGADLAGLIGGAIVGRLKVPADEPFLKAEPPPGRFGSFEFGDDMHLKIGEAIQEKYPNVPMQIRVGKGQTGIDITVLREEDVAVVGFKYADIKPNTESGEKSLADQVKNWKDKGKLSQSDFVQPITYNADGTVNLGFTFKKIKQ